MGSPTPDISFFISSMGDGGAQRTIANLAKGFTEKDYDVEILLLRSEGPYLESLPSDVEIVALEADRAIKSVPQLVSYVKKKEPKVLFTTMEYLNVVSLISKFFARTSTKFVVRVANVSSEKDRAGFKNYIQHLLAKRLYPRADRLIALSEHVRRDASGYYRIDSDEISVIYNPVSIEEIRELATRDVDLSFVADDSDLVLNVGRFVEQKDVHTTIRAFDRVNDDRDAELLLLGKGEQKDELVRLANELCIEDRVHMPGFVANPFAYMAAADVFVLSSKWEGFGHVIVEALACETPVVSTDCPGGPSEILEDGTFGRLVPVGDHVALAEAIDRTLEDPIDGKTLLKRAKDFDYKQITDQYEDVMPLDG